MAKKKTTRIQQKKKFHPLFALMTSFFAVLLIAVAFTAHMYKDVSPLQEVAGASTTAHVVERLLPSVTPTPACLIVRTITGAGTCSKDTYSSITVTCGDGTIQKLPATSTTCRSLSSWMVQVASVCKNHAACTPLPSKTPTPNVSRVPHMETHVTGQPNTVNSNRH